MGLAALLHLQVVFAQAMPLLSLPLLGHLQASCLKHPAMGFQIQLKAHLHCIPTFLAMHCCSVPRPPPTQPPPPENLEGSPVQRCWEHYLVLRRHPQKQRQPVAHLLQGEGPQELDLLLARCYPLCQDCWLD